MKNQIPTYGKQIKIKLVEIGTTQKAISQKISMSSKYLNKIITGRRSGTTYLPSIERTLNTTEAKTTNFTSYGTMVKRKLIEKDMTQVELAEMCKCSKQYLHKILTGERSGEKYLDAINTILGISNYVAPNKKNRGL